jgi:two-component system, chemotaxis family, chemotaxis protein CheY
MSNDKKGTVLLLDDDKFMVDMYSMKFTQQGFDVHACMTAIEAVDAIKGGVKPDVIVFDIKMPEHDGFDFLQMLNRDHLVEGVLRIALTNESDEAEERRAMELGADRYVIKASNLPSEVVNIVEQALLNHKGA